MSQFTLLQKRAAISVVAAVGVHAFVFALWILLLVWDLPLFAFQAPPSEPRPEPEVTVMLRPMLPLPEPKPLPLPEPPTDEPQLQPLPKPPQPPKPEVAAQTPTPKPSVVVKPKADQVAPSKEADRRFARTSADQAGTPDAPTDILGERDTRAASEQAPTPGAPPNTPSQDGSAPLHPDHVETVDSTHKDGSVGMDKTGEETETPQEASARKDSSTIDEAPTLVTPKPDEGESARPKNKHLEQGLMLPTADDGDGKKAIQDRPKADESPKEKPNEGAKKDGRGDATEQDPKKDGFNGLSRKTKVTGSISRRGKSALNVKNSPLGRYQALVSKAVELQWRRNCEQYRDHIVPGVISMRFYVDENGKVSGIKVQEVVEGNLIERGFTQRAIRQAKLPKMSKSVIKELKGEPLELIYNFYF
ncbi:hypothetical protein NT6N_03850 [Oceaniferula spumae]|uniref:TonB C-terminal domain-containing protein n=1 Tax=Oceaniferula spumae TaxID=2979115 RepID=A0AAT9FH91_9BACT